MTITREQWQNISPLLAQALEMPAVARAAWLAELDTTQPLLSPLLRTLLAADRRAEQGRAFETASVLVGAATRESSDLHAEQQVGPYRLARQLGRGGMGEVWLARQVEGGITRDVALKLPTLLGPASFWRERFRRERDILASLQHPNIATLFDAGVAENPGAAAQPWLAMEYVEGDSLLEHVARRDMPLRERILLFRQVLAAVGCAHRQLVIHRDLKPSNILVTKDGQAKLLDFGIARLIEDEVSATADDLTRLGGRLLTFRYAAPEQVHGETLSTATDVYALGVVLHELLTGQSPYGRVRDGSAPGPADFQQQDFALPSSLTTTKGIAGDLDAILLKALRRDPVDRYGTVEQFDADLQRHLAHLPVLARRGSRRYRVGRFLVRHRLALVAATVMVLSLLTGLVVAERERRVAVAARARAELHFQSVRELANTFIFNIDRKLMGIAGTLPARQELVETSVKYLDRLAAEAGGDKALAAEVASGYRRIGEVQGGGAGGNLGQWDEALATFNKAAKLFDALDGYGRDDARIVDEQQRVHYQLAGAYARKQDPRWEAESLKSLDGLRELARLGNSAQARLTAAVQMFEHVNTQAVIDHSAHLDSPLLREGRDLLDAAARDIGADPKARASLAAAYTALADVLAAPGNTPAQASEALRAAGKARDILASLVQDAPDNMNFALLLALARGSAIDSLLTLQRFSEAEEEMKIVLRELALIQARDPLNIEVAANHWAAMAEGVETAFRAGEPLLVRQRAAQARSLWLKLPQAVHLSPTIAPFQARADYSEGLVLLSGAAGERAEGCRRLRAVETYLPQLRASDAGEAVVSSRFARLAPALAQCPSPLRGTAK